MTALDTRIIEKRLAKLEAVTMISVVIPAYNEEHYLGACLAALNEQNTTTDFEIIVVNNASTDHTRQVALEHTTKNNLRIIDEPQKGRGAARSTGFAAAQGSIILSTDADAIVPSNWVDKMIEYFEDPAIVAVSGTCYITDRGWFANTLFNIIQPLAMHLHRLAFGNYWLTGSNFAIRAYAYQQSGGFNRALNSQEDTQLSFQVKKLGRRKFVSRPAVLVSGRRFKKGMAIGLFDYMRSFSERFVLRKIDVHLDDSR